MIMCLVAFTMFSCAKKETVSAKVETKTEATIDAKDIVVDSDNLENDVEVNIEASYENAERVGDFLFTEKSDKGDVTSIVALANKDAGIKTFQFDVLDLDDGYDDMAALTIDFDGTIIPEGGQDNVRESGDDIVITSGGIYVLKGTLNNKRVRVEKGLGPMTQIVLNGVKINTDKESAILTPKECITQIHLAKGSVNEINSTSNEASSKASKRNGVIFSEEKMSFKGSGKLIINNAFALGVKCVDLSLKLYSPPSKSFLYSNLLVFILCQIFTVFTLSGPTISIQFQC